MAKHDFIFVDESGDPGYVVDSCTGQLRGSAHFLLAALHVTDQSINVINRHLAAFRYYTAFDRELKLPPDMERFSRLLEPICQAAEQRSDIHASVVYLDKENYTGSYLKPGGLRPQSQLYFRNRVLRCLLEHHFAHYQLESDQYDLILDRVDMNLEQIDNQRQYLNSNQNFRGPRYITHASSIYVEGLQVVDHIARGFKDVVYGSTVPDSLGFVIGRDITTDRDTWRK